MAPHNNTGFYLLDLSMHHIACQALNTHDLSTEQQSLEVYPIAFPIFTTLVTGFQSDSFFSERFKSPLSWCAPIQGFKPRAVCLLLKSATFHTKTVASAQLRWEVPALLLPICLV